MNEDPRRPRSPVSRRVFLATAVGGLLAYGGYEYFDRSDTARTQSAPQEGQKNFPMDRAAVPVYVGYVPYWDQPNAISTVERHPAIFDQASLVWYSLDDSARVVPSDDQYTKIDPSIVTTLQGMDIKVIPTVTSLRNGDWQPDLVRSMLSDSSTIDTHVASIRDLVVRSRYDGIDIDYEDLGEDNRDSYSEFLTKLSAALHAEDKILTSSVYAKNSEPGPNDHNKAQNYAAIGAACDQVRVMTFDYHYTDSDPGPTAPLDWVDRMIAWAVTQIPARKVMLGVVLLGYDWPDGKSASGVSYKQAHALALQYGATVQRAPGDDSPHFDYTAGDQTLHHVWFEDARSSAQKLTLVKRHGLGGAIFWRLGGEDPATWDAPGLSSHR